MVPTCRLLAYCFQQPAIQFFMSSQQQQCRHFLRGRCTFGANCRFSHDRSPVPVRPSPGRGLAREAAGTMRLNGDTPPADRSWTHAQSATSASSSHGSGDLAFRVMSYNTLADKLAAEHAAELYGDIPLDWIAWETRGPRLMQEIIGYGADVIALQEVDIVGDFEAALGVHGYEGTYAKRGGDKADGCATLWRKDAFKMLAIETIHFSEHALRDNVALIVVLEARQQPAASANSSEASKQRRLILGNVHILFNPKRGDIKLAQVRILATKLAELSEQYKSAVIMCGDFNSTPDSAIYRFCSAGQLALSRVDRRTMSGQLGDAVSPGILGWQVEHLSIAMGSSPRRGPAPPADWVATHPLQLRSAYAEIAGTEPAFTTSHQKALKTVDYQWFTPQTGSFALQPLRVLDPPPLEGLHPLPTDQFPSDHICLVVDYGLSPRMLSPSEQPSGVAQD